MLAAAAQTIVGRKPDLSEQHTGPIAHSAWPHCHQSRCGGHVGGRTVCPTRPTVEHAGLLVPQVGEHMLSRLANGMTLQNNHSQNLIGPQERLQDNALIWLFRVVTDGPKA